MPRRLKKDIITWASVFDDVPISFTLEDSGEYSAWPKNNPRVYSGLTNINHAIETSRVSSYFLQFVPVLIVN